MNAFAAKSSHVVVPSYCNQICLWYYMSTWIQSKIQILHMNAKGFNYTWEIFIAALEGAGGIIEWLYCMCVSLLFALFLIVNCNAYALLRKKGLLLLTILCICPMLKDIFHFLACWSSENKGLICEQSFFFSPARI